MTTARIRNLWGEEVDAEIIDLDPPANAPGVICVKVPGLGHLFLSTVTGTPRALLTQGPGREHERSVHTIDVTPEGADEASIAAGLVSPVRRYEIELLPNVAGQDRIVVVIEP